MKETFSPTFTSSEHSLSRPAPPFDFLPLGRVIFEPGGLARLPESVQSLGGHHALLVTDPGLEHAGHPQRARQLLLDAGLRVTVFDGVKENPTENEVLAGVTLARHSGIDVIVALGGGSSMDCAKGINFLLTNGGRMLDYKGHGKATQPMLPSIGIPTTSGTGSEAQSYALITDPSTHMKMACGDKKAAFRISILDPELTLSQPRMVTAVTGIDALAHAVESLVCTKANAISRMASLAAWQHLEPNLEVVLQEPGNRSARAEMQIGAYLAGMAIENAMLGITHSCANPLTAHYGLTHGVAIGLMLPHVIRFNAQSAYHDYALLASLMKGPASSTSDPVEALAARIEELVRVAGLPSRLRDCDVSMSILKLLAEEANQQWTARFNPRVVNEQDLFAVYHAAW